MYDLGEDCYILMCVLWSSPHPQTYNMPIAKPVGYTAAVTQSETSINVYASKLV